MSKLIKLKDAMAWIHDGDTVGLGGNVLHRAPMGLVREMIRSYKKDLKLVKTAGAMDVDMLCLAECVASVDAGFISYESEFSLADHYRKAVQQGRVRANEHACYTVISALRAASAGIPFMPVKGLMVSDLIEANDYFEKVIDPFSKEEVAVVRVMRPDVVLLHVQEADELGNAMIYGPKFEDVLLAKAAKKVIISAEKIVETRAFYERGQKVTLPHFLVSGVVHMPNGASPCSCERVGEIDRVSIKAFKEIKRREEFEAYMKRYEIEENL